jgi:NAD(P)-dependent dehydrogenase (short-subunit alcohol dehydrogenase family)
MADLADRLAVVVGGTEGIGLGIARALGEAGARVVVGGRTAPKLDAAVDELGHHGIAASSHVVDVADTGSISEFAAAIAAEAGPPAILVNSAGMSITKPALDVTPDEWDAVHDVQLRGVFFTCQAFAPVMIDQGYGKIINLGSTWGATVSPGRSVYAIAKAGLSHLTASLGVEWAEQGVRVNAIAPTSTMTPRVERRFEATPDREEFLRSRIPMGRIATVQDVVGSAVFLASGDSDFITGHTLFVDGGWHFAR